MNQSNFKSFVGTAVGNVRPLLRPSSHQSVRKDAIVEPRTGSFDRLRGRSALVALDLENIDRSASGIGRAVDYGRLARVLRDGIGQSTHLIAVFSRAEDEIASERLLREAGWITYTRPIDTVWVKGEIFRHGNADVAFATAVGAAVVALNVEVCVLGTGDGQLAIDVARCLKVTAPRCTTAATLSLAGSTSHRLDVRQSDIFAVNLEIGDDVMNPLAVPSGDGGSEAPMPAVSAAPALADLAAPASLILNRKKV